MQVRRYVLGVAVILALGVMDRAWAQQGAALSAPVNPAFQEYLRELQAGRHPTRSADGHPLGGIPSAVDLSHLAVKGAARTSRDTSLPASYDLRTLGKVTPIKNQNPYGTCWAHATFGSMESCLEPGATWDFSENNLVNLSGYDVTQKGLFNQGGNAFMASAYLTRWAGPVSEADDPYPNPGGSTADKTVQKHVQQIQIVPSVSPPGNNDYVKRALMTYGAVDTSMCWDDASYKAENASFYYAGQNGLNHFVTIVGWDDNYDRTRFATAAPGNGAWIIKNSWGTGWGDKGYCFCSYYDTVVAAVNFVFMNTEAPSNYERVYQYDPLGLIGIFAVSSPAAPSAWGANEFVNAEGSARRIAAASFYTMATNTSYELYIYTGVTAGAPRSGTLRATAHGTLALAGYYTVPIDPPAALAANETFSVVLHLTTPGLNYPLAVEYANAQSLSSKATSAPGQSFMSPDGTQWRDCTQVYDPTANLCIKAFVVAAGGAGVSTSTPSRRNSFIAPANPAYQSFVREAQAGRRPTRSAEGHMLGAIPSPIDLSHISVKGARVMRDRSLPPLYDLRTLGKVTPVKNQNPYGTCWAHATYGSLESFLLPGATWDFSEDNLVNLSGYDAGQDGLFNAGGTAQMATAYLARWSGPISESDDPYPNTNGSPTDKPVQKHVQQVRVIPYVDPPGDNPYVKHAIVDYGGVYTTICWDDAFYKAQFSSLYYTSTNPINHAVTIVGWDDNFDRTRFATPAPGNGAWIIKNSWGPGWGDKGYFYCSYYDTHAAGENFVFMNAEAPANFARVYQYDPLGWVANGSVSDPPAATAWGANVFANAEGSARKIAAASFYAVATNTSYELYIYTGVAAGAPRSGTLRASARGTLAAAGYYTIPMTPPAEVAANESFSVVVQLTTPGFSYPMAIEYADPYWGSSKATAAPGQSFVSADGTQWNDCTQFYDPTANLCIKAFVAATAPQIAGAPDVHGVVTPGAGGRDEPQVIETAVGQTFTLVTPSGQPVDLFIGPTASPDEADLRLMFTGNQRSGGLPPQTFANRFEGAWMSVGTRAAAKTFGKIFNLEEGHALRDGVQWVFEHRLQPGQSYGIYQNRDGQWVNTHTVTCR